MNSNRWNFKRTVLSGAVALLAVAPVMVMAQTTSVDEDTPRAKEDAVRLGTITVVGSGGKLGTGQMVKDDSVKGRSTVTKASMEKDLATGNVLQSIALLPGVNTYNYDATGLFGGDVSIRGFSSDQIGFTVNGVPVNDSGGYSFYAQEMIDNENVCTASVAQGSPELESPHSGATGGSVSIITCDPADKRRVRFSQTLGGLNMNRTYVRVDSGRFANDMAKVFLSYSHSEADKWKGEGKGRKDHIDAGFSLDLSPDNRLLGSVLYNRMVNNNIYSVSLKQLEDYGYSGYDYSSTFNSQATPENGTAQTESAQSPVYYGMALNPFKNVIASLSGSFKLAKDTYLKVQPYFWYGFGNGGWSEQALSESTGLMGGAADINGDGDTLDTVRVARASVTKTNRPGITGEVSTTLSNHYLKVGLWYERAQHRQTQPAVLINSDGTPSDIWLQNNCVTRADGTCYQGRDAKTISTSYQAYVNDQISLLDDRAFLSLGLRAPNVTRDVTSYANEGGTSVYTVNDDGSYTKTGTVYQDFNIKRSFSTLLPQIGTRFNLDSTQHVFVNVAKNFRAPPNYAYYGSYVGLVNGVISPIVDIKPETSWMTDLGYRYQSRAFSLSATLFNSNFKNRQVAATDPNSQVSTYVNAGGVTNRGLELELGSGIYKGFSAYSSLTLQKSKMKDDLQVSSSIALPTSGKQFGKTPEKMAALSLQYEQGPFYVRLKAKYTGSQYSDLMNQEKAPGYTTGDLDAGYKLPDFGMLKSPQFRLNVSNVGNAKYRSASSIVTNAAATTVGSSTYSAKTAYYYLGAPRLITMSLSADFE